MDKGKNIQMRLTGEELRRKIEQITRKIQEVREERLRVEVATSVYKAATATLDEELMSKEKRKKSIEEEKEDLSQKLDMLRLQIQEREAREAEIDSETASLLAKNVSLDEELKAEMTEFIAMEERMSALRKKNKAFHHDMIDKIQKMHGKYSIREQGGNSGPDNAHPELTKEDDGEEIVYKPPFLGRLKGRE